MPEVLFSEYFHTMEIGFSKFFCTIFKISSHFGKVQFSREAGNRSEILCKILRLVLSLLLSGHRFNFLTFESQQQRAFNAGAIGAVYFTDPMEYAKEGVDKVYPDYNWLPKSAVQRGNILNPGIRGDPLTPGYPSVG